MIDLMSATTYRMCIIVSFPEHMWSILSSGNGAGPGRLSNIASMKTLFACDQGAVCKSALGASFRTFRIRGVCSSQPRDRGAGYFKSIGTPTSAKYLRRFWISRSPLIVAIMVDPAGDGVTLLYVTIVMLALSWLGVIMRLSVRRWLKPEAMGMDDALMCAGLVCYASPTIWGF